MNDVTFHPMSWKEGRAIVRIVILLKPNRYNEEQTILLL